MAVHLSKMAATMVGSRENLSSGFATKVDSNWPAQPQKLDRGLKLRIYKLGIILSRQQTTKVLIRPRRLICTFVVCIWLKQVFS